MVDEQVAYWQSLAQQAARERDERYDQLRNSENEADRLRKALQAVVINLDGNDYDGNIFPQAALRVARDALALRQEEKR